MAGKLSKKTPHKSENTSRNITRGARGLVAADDGVYCIHSIDHMLYTHNLIHRDCHN